MQNHLWEVVPEKEMGSKPHFVVENPNFRVRIHVTDDHLYATLLSVVLNFLTFRPPFWIQILD